MWSNFHTQQWVPNFLAGIEKSTRLTRQSLPAVRFEKGEESGSPDKVIAYFVLLLL